MAEKPKILMATVYIKSQSGRSLLREGKATPVDPRPYLPSSETIDKAVAKLQQLGFKIEAKGVTLSISGPPELFEQTCGVRYRLKTDWYKSLENPNLERNLFLEAPNRSCISNNWRMLLMG